MSRLFSASGHMLQRSSYDVDLSTEGMIAVMYSSTAAANDNLDHVLWQFYNGSESFYCVKGADNKFYVDWFKTGRTAFIQVPLGSYSWDTSGWNILVYRWNGSEIEARFKDASSTFTSGPFSDDLVGRWDTSSSTTLTIGNGSAGGVNFAGRLAWFAIWNKALSTSNLVDAIWQARSPVASNASHAGLHPEYLVDCWPLEGIFSPEQDWADGCRSLTVTGAAAAGDPPMVLDSGAGESVGSFIPGFLPAQTAGNLMPMFIGRIRGFGAA